MSAPPLGPCSLCDEPGVVVINGAWFCIPHCDDGFRAAARCVAVLRGADPDVVEAGAVEMLENLQARREELDP